MALVFKDVIDAANEGSLLGFLFHGGAACVSAIFIRQKVECRLYRSFNEVVSCGVYRFCSRRLPPPSCPFQDGVNHHANALQHKKKGAEFGFLLSIPAILGGAVLGNSRCGQRRRSINKLSGRARRCRCRVSSYFAWSTIKLIQSIHSWGFAILRRFSSFSSLRSKPFCTLSLGKSAAKRFIFYRKAAKNGLHTN